MHPDQAFEYLSEIYDQFGDFCSRRGQVSESDTRSKVIDRILTGVLGWPESLITREEYVERGYIDYLLSSTAKRRLLVVEAKREGIPFDLPSSKATKYKLDASIKSNELLYEAIEQAQRYCVEHAVRYAVVTNGYAWVIFRAIREDIPWRKGSAVVFASAGEVKRRFKDFVNLLSYPNVQSGSLDSYFSTIQPVARNLLRLLDRIHNCDRPLIRNRFHEQLHPIVDQIFGDIAEQGQIEILEKCYVHTKTLQIMDRDLQRAIIDSVPAFAAQQGAKEVVSGWKDAGEFETALDGAVKQPGGSVFLLLGGIGAGKSTFMKRFFRHVGKEFIEEIGCWFYVTFLQPPKMSDLEQYVYHSILSDLRERYADEKLETKENLLEAFDQRIQTQNKVILHDETEEEYKRRISGWLEKWVDDSATYVGALLRLLRRRGKAVVICIDNVDQLSPEYQSDIFLLAQRLAKDLSAVVIVALREESFYAASIRKTFTAYNIRKFHIASPCFRRLIGTRLRYARQVLALPDNDVRLILASGASIEKKSIDAFLQIIETSLFSRNRNIVRFIECISFGNMRDALEMFASFLYSGNTYVDKMLAIFSQQGAYYVAFHEFAKSVILGDRYYYREQHSRIMNIFNCGAEKNSSHFTGLRLLGFLLEHQGASHPEGQGFVDISRVLNGSIELFDNEEDFLSTADRLLKRSLIEVDTRATDTIRNSTFVRITAAGWYYISYLSKAFAYLDLILQDTPINDGSVVDQLLELTKRIDEIPESAEHRLAKVEMRLERTQVFIDYLVFEEMRERKRFDLDNWTHPLNREVMTPIKDQFAKEAETIREKLTREGYDGDREEALEPEPPVNLNLPIEREDYPD